MLQTLGFSLEIKGLTDGGAFEGYASTFNERDLGGDIVVPGAFTKSLKARGAKGVRMFADHDSSKRIGVWTEIAEDERGLAVKGQLLTQKTIGQEAYIDLKAGALDGLSIGFRTKQDSYDGRRKARMLKEVDLLEISLVSFPMNESARVTGIKAVDGIKTIREFEDFLRDVGGYSHAAAKAIAKGGFKASDPRDEDDAVAIIRRNIETLTRN
jgi:HK97 family phage prohead protease